jgi:hypothetical protein
MRDVTYIPADVVEQEATPAMVHNLVGSVTEVQLHSRIFGCGFAQTFHTANVD